MLDIRDAEGSDPTAREIQEFVKSGEARKTLSELGKVHDVGPFSLERRAGYWGDISMTHERAGVRLYQRARMYQLFFRGKVIGIMCAVAAREGEDQKGNESAVLIKPVCQQVVNSVVLEQVY